MKRGSWRLRRRGKVEERLQSFPTLSFMSSLQETIKEAVTFPLSFVVSLVRSKILGAGQCGGQGESQQAARTVDRNRKSVQSTLDTYIHRHGLDGSHAINECVTNQKQKAHWRRAGVRSLTGACSSPITMHGFAGCPLVFFVSSMCGVWCKHYHCS